MGWVMVVSERVMVVSEWVRPELAELWDMMDGVWI